MSLGRMLLEAKKRRCGPGLVHPKGPHELALGRRAPFITNPNALIKDCGGDATASPAKSSRVAPSDNVNSPPRSSPISPRLYAGGGGLGQINLPTRFYHRRVREAIFVGFPSLRWNGRVLICRDPLLPLLSQGIDLI